ncbi:MAG TPA: hypothetical protein VHZ02_03295, partial [Acidimicrobiales bacterium]|nr:hypothetical protein [Acidimicrobiales bacterium]
GSVVVAVVIVVIIGVVVIGSLAEINAQSSPFRTMVNRSFGALASPVVNSSTQTGRELASTIKGAAGPSSSRASLQQMLDQVVTEATTQSDNAADLVPPAAVGSLDQQLVAVFAERATAATAMRTTIDGLLGMVPLPVAGAPVSLSAPPQQAPPLTTAQAVAALSSVGTTISKADADYAAVRRALARAPGPVRLPRSSWVTGSSATAPLGPTQLAAAPPALAASSALAQVNQLLISAMGLSPPAVGSVGTVGDNCPNPISRPAAAPATVLPPIRRLSAQVTVTNCGNVNEKGIVVSMSVQLAPGSPPPASTTSSTSRSTTTSPPTTASASPSSARRTIALTPGRSTSLTLGPLAVAHGGQYVVTVSVTTPSGQTSPAGTTQAFLVQISS